ncbi:hypothetical protein [Rhodococcus sp. ARC_M6]|uniref:hypothetical protein n=1 Tax=Rhodococcus sp. ARC_M6 TaxID=2928852 RepID=UPI001FB55267|nr:hypothetical protein [Rhodococcus sp. ARC_M6]MCJ0902837.1 hypothetical protein [Rhodococcus sp. ARC_M6]
MNDNTSIYGLFAIHASNKLRNNDIQPSTDKGLVERLSGLFREATTSGELVTPRRLAEVLSDPQRETVKPEISAPTSVAGVGFSSPQPVSLVQAAEGLSDESLDLLYQAFEHLLRSEISEESDQLVAARVSS